MGSISKQAWLKGSHTLPEVIGNGMGIKEEYQGRIFSM
jgi:hypothetical protein